MIKQILNMLDPERAHSIAKWGMKHRLMASGQFQTLESPITLFGQRLANPVGLAAGFDKNGELTNVIGDYGFGFMEVGSVTLCGGSGNPKPRLFRTHDDGILNRMGLNGEPVSKVACRLFQANEESRKYLPPQSQLYGVNIAKTHSPDIMGDAAIDDICCCFDRMRGFGFYTVLNISCPNTKEGRTFEDPAPLRELLGAVRHRPSGWPHTNKPLLVKLSPALKLQKLDDVIKVCQDAHIDGFVCCNTEPMNHVKFGKGGQSGPPIFGLAIPIVKRIKEIAPDKVIIGCGGISRGADIVDFMNAGATAVQVYSAFVRGPHSGPLFVHRIMAEYLETKYV